MPSTHKHPWHAVTEITDNGGDISPDTPFTEAYTVTFRMDNQPAGSEGSEIVIYAYGEYTDPNGQREDGSFWPDIAVTVMIGFEIRDWDNCVNEADYTYDTDFDVHAYTLEDLANGTVMKAARAAAESYTASINDYISWDGMNVHDIRRAMQSG